MLDLSKYKLKQETREEQFTRYKIQLEREYSNIEEHFGPTHVISPIKVDDLINRYYFKKIDPKGRLKRNKCPSETEEPMSTKRSTRSNSAVNQQIKGKCYFLRLGNVPTSSRMTAYDNFRKPVLDTTFTNFSNVYPKRSQEIIKNCQDIIDRPATCDRKVSTYMEKPYKLQYTQKRTYNHAKQKKQHIKNVQLIDSINGNIKLITRLLQQGQQY